MPAAGGRPPTEASRRCLLRLSASLTEQGRRDIRSLCLDPDWLIRSLRNRPIPQIAADLARSTDPDLVRLSQLLLRGAHLTSDSRSKTHLVNTVLAWLATDRRLDPIVQRYAHRVRHPYLLPLWTLAPGGDERSRTLRRHLTRVRGCRFSTDGQSLITMDDLTAVIWDVNSGSYVGEADPRRLWNGQRIEVSPGQLSRVRVSVGGDNQLAVLDPEGLLGVWSLEGVPQARYVVDTNRDGDPPHSIVDLGPETFACGSEDALRIRRWASGEILLTAPLNGRFGGISVDQDQRICAVEADNGIVDVWNLRDHQHLARVRIGGNGTLIAHLVIDGDLLLAVDFDGVGRLWDWPRGRQLPSVRGIADQPDLDSRTRTLRWLHQPGELVVRPIRSGSVIATAVSGKVVEVLRGAADQDDDRIYGRKVPLSERVLATISTLEHSNGTAFEHVVDFFDTSTGRRLGGGSGPDQVAHATAGSPPDELLLVTTTGRIETWSRDGMTRCDRVPVGFNDLDAAATSPDADWLAAAVEDEVHLLRPSNTGRTVQPPFYPMIGQLLDVVADPAGRWLATLTDQLELDIWDPRTAQLRFHCPGSAPTSFRNGNDHIRAFSPDGRWIAVNDLDDTLLVWDPSTGRALPGLPSQQGDLVYVASGPNGPVVVLRHRDRQLSAWDVATRRHMVTLPPSDVVVGDVGGRWLAGIAADGKVFVWGLALNRWLPSPGAAAVLTAERGGRFLYLSGEYGVQAVDPITGWRQSLLVEDPQSGRPAAHPLLSEDGKRCVVVQDDGQILSIAAPSGGPVEARPAGRTRLTKADGLRRRLSPSGRLMATAQRSTDYLEVIDLDATAAGTRTRASITLDGHIWALAWQADSTLAVVGLFGVQLLTLKTPRSRK